MNYFKRYWVIKQKWDRVLEGQSIPNYFNRFSGDLKDSYWCPEIYRALRLYTEEQVTLVLNELYKFSYDNPTDIDNWNDIYQIIQLTEVAANPIIFITK